MQVLRNAKNRQALDASQTMYPCRLDVLLDAGRMGRDTSTVYATVVGGTAQFQAAACRFEAPPGGYFVAPGEITISPAPGARVYIIERFGFRSPIAAGVTEARGRLSYIDGCSDSILAMPPRLGDPVLNLLHFPRGIEQSQHSHPSVRLGVVVSGRGEAFGPGGPGGWKEPLAAGDAFLIDAQEVHSFRTFADEPMSVVAFHPDSDWGPTDGAHPMLNRTYLAPDPRRK